MRTKFYINNAQFETEKEIDGNNFLVAYDVPIAKTGIQQYTRGELGDKSGDPDELVNVYRDQSVFEDPKLVESFNGIPIVYRHPDNGKVDNNNFKDFVVGTVSGVYYKNGDLFAKKLTIIDKEAILNVLEKNTNELSIGFRGSVVKEKGTFNGMKYEFKENVIHANHLALCENGKAGAYYAINSKKGSRKMNFTNEEKDHENEGHTDGGLNPNIHGLIEQAVKKKLAEIHPKNFGDSDEEMENAEKEDGEEEEGEVKKEMKKDHKMKKNESDPELEKSEHEDKDIINALKRSNRTLKDLLKTKNDEIRKLDLKNIKLDEALTEAQEYVRDMANHLKTRKLSHALSGPDSILNPTHPRQMDMANSMTQSFLIK